MNRCWPWALVMLGLAACAAQPETETVKLRIENADAQAIRCQAILAHFVTRSLPEIAAGGAQEVILERDPGQGTLSYGTSDGRPMMLENILCGRVADWTETARDLPLQALRTGTASRFAARCRLRDGRTTCRLP